MFTKKTLNENDLCVKYIFREKSELMKDGKPRSRILVPREGEKLSLYEVTDLIHDDVCSHGHTYADNKAKGRRHIGYVKFIHETFLRLKLIIIYDDKPPRHLSVKFSGSPEYRREVAKALADEVVVIDARLPKKHFAVCK